MRGMWDVGWRAGKEKKGDEDQEQDGKKDNLGIAVTGTFGMTRLGTMKWRRWFLAISGRETLTLHDQVRY